MERGENRGSLNKLAFQYLSEYENEYSFRESINLLGWSLGGLIALEIAGILEERGHKHIKVTLLDTFIRKEPTTEINSNLKENYIKEVKSDLLKKYHTSYAEKVVSAIKYEEQLVRTPISSHLKTT